MNDCDRIHDLLRQIRDFINSPRPQHAIMQVIHDWHKLCSALDLVGDTTAALSSYREMDYPENDGGKYLLLYGLLQALYLQQDGITHIAEALGQPKGLPPEMREVREIRNDAVGHPSSRGMHNKPKTFHFVARITISKTGFQLMSTTPIGRGHIIRQIGVIGLVNKQTTAVVSYLQSVLTEIQKKEQAHRSRFRDMKLADIFPQTMDYCFSKVFEGIYSTGQGYRQYGKINLDMIIEKYTQFKAELEKRGEVPASDWLAYNLDQMIYPLQRLREFYESPSTSRLNDRDALIFASFARDLHEEMVQIAKEIDEKYETGSE